MVSILSRTMLFSFVECALFSGFFELKENVPLNCLFFNFILEGDCFEKLFPSRSEMFLFSSEDLMLALT